MALPTGVVARPVDLILSRPNRKTEKAPTSTRNEYGAVKQSHMSAFVRVQVNVGLLTNAIVGFLNDPHPDRINRHPELFDDDLEHNLGLTQDLLETLLLEGATTEADIAPLVHHLARFGADGSRVPATDLSTDPKYVP